jgi:signal transduction histidine kinase/CheY-like chemotaxis protein
VLKTGKPIYDQDVLVEKPDGSRIFAAVNIVPLHDRKGRTVGALSCFTDVTKRKELELQLFQAQKMEAIGHLAGGIAHDFNNLLFVILGRTEFLLRELDGATASYSHLKDIQQAAEQARWLTAQLLILGRSQAVDTQVIDLNTSVKEASQLFDRIIGEDIELVTRLRPNLGLVRADRGLSQQVIMNLAVNARDAMPEGGKLTIETANESLDLAYEQQHPGFPYVMLAVSDTGIGMDSDTQRRIFEPYFTTKGPGKGSGLGLSIVQSIIAQSGGHVSVQSELGQGSTFRVYLPRVDEAVEAPRMEKRGENIPRGSETVLLVEDAHGVRILTREYLASTGYSVLVAEDGPEAIEAAQKHQGPIHLLLTDVVMPGMNGQELAGRLTAMRPEMKVLYMSGYTNEIVFRHGISESGPPLLQKPFTLDELARQVRDVLEAPPRE